MAKGYNAPAGGKSGGSMMAQIAKLQEQMAKAQDELATESVTESAGGGAVSVRMSGDQQVLEVHIEPDLLTAGDTEMVQDLVLTAVNKALASAKALSENKMAPVTNLLSGMGMGR